MSSLLSGYFRFLLLSPFLYRCAPPSESKPRTEVKVCIEVYSFIPSVRYIRIHRSGFCVATTSPRPNRRYLIALLKPSQASNHIPYIHHGSSILRAERLQVLWVHARSNSSSTEDADAPRHLGSGAVDLDKLGIVSILHPHRHQQAV